MKEYIIANTRDNMIAGIQTKIMLDGCDLEVKTARTVAALYNICDNDASTHIILGPQIVRENGFDLSRLTGHPYSGFAVRKSDEAVFIDSNIPCIGIAKDSDALIELLLKDKLPSAMMKAEPMQYIDVDAIEAEEEEEDPVPQTPTAQQPAFQPVSVPVQNPAPTPTQPMGNASITPEQMAMFMQFMQQMGMNVMPQTPQTNAPVQTAPQPDPQPVPVGQEAPQPASTQAEQPSQNPPELSRREKRRKEKERAKAIEQSRAPVVEDASFAVKNRREGDDEITKALERDGIYFDAKHRKSEASVITVYAAKGGVGKTTVATELAAYLALTSNGRNRLSVCVIDYNIDFGDVCSHLGLNPKGNNMISWAAEIDAMINDGVNPEDISFTESNIRKGYLQKMDKTDLFALIAPIAHEDSMDISDNALKVMLRNIVENGGFDYVVIDTGNNTRDAAIIALEAAEHVLMIATQDLTTANCNSSVLEVLSKMEKKRPGLNTGKISLVINNIIPSNEAGVSTKDVEDAFPFPCIAKIKRTPDVLKANNFSRPLIYNAKHLFTHQIQRIVQYVTMGELTEDTYEEKKPKGFARLFKK